MDFYVLSHCSDAELLRISKSRRAGERGSIAATLAALCEVEARKLYVKAGYPSLFRYCVEELGYSEDEAGKRIHATRTAREFSDLIFPALEDGRLHLTAVILLAPRLTPANANELLAAAAHKSRSQIELLIAQRFPRADVPERIRALSPSPTHSAFEGQHAPERVDHGTEVPEGLPAWSPSLALAAPTGGPHALERVERPGLGLDRTGPEGQSFPSSAEHAPERVPAPEPRPRVVPLAPQRYALQLTMSQATHDKLRYAQQLLSHAVRPGDVAEVLDRALDALIVKLERQKFAATDKPRPGQIRSGCNPRHIPRDVKRRVWKRDGGRCTFVSDEGRRCESREILEYHHVQEAARGGLATEENIRLRCRAHNQYAAECAYGVEFMELKRIPARRAGSGARDAGAPAD